MCHLCVCLRNLIWTAVIIIFHSQVFGIVKRDESSVQRRTILMNYKELLGFTYFYSLVYEIIVRGEAIKWIKENLGLSKSWISQTRSTHSRHKFIIEVHYSQTIMRFT